MEALNIEETAVVTIEQSMPDIEKLRFEKLLENSISSEEFERRAIQHLIQLYEDRDERQTHCPLYQRG